MKNKKTTKVFYNKFLSGLMCALAVIGGVLIVPQCKLEVEAKDHYCSFVWRTISEGSGYQDLVQVYQCDVCNKIDWVYYKTSEGFVRDRLYEQIKDARNQGVIASEFGLCHTVEDSLFTRLTERNDVTVMVTYQYDDNYYQTTFPAGADYSELLQDSEKYYGMPGLNGRCGITTSMGRDLDGGNLVEEIKSNGAEEVYSHIKLAPKQETVYADYGNVHTINDSLIINLTENKTVSTVITYEYDGKNYKTTFPAGADYTELLNDGEQYYGMLGLNGRCGIVTELIQ